MATILPDLSQQLLAMQAMIDRLAADNASLKAANASARPVKLKVTEKGALSFYGLGQWPVTLYVSQWDVLLAHTDMVREFMAANAATLTRKPKA